ASEVTDLPEPDSPTTTKVSPRSMWKETPATAGTTPSSVAKSTCRSRTSSRCPVIPGAASFLAPTGVEEVAERVAEQVDAQHELGGLDRQHLAADQAGILRRGDDSDGDHRVHQAGAERRHDDQRQQQIGKRQEDVDKAHDHRIDAAAEIAAHQAERHAKRER